MELILTFGDRIQNVVIKQLDELVYLVQLYFNILPKDQNIEFNSHLIDTSKKFQDYLISSGDLLMIKKKQYQHKFRKEDDISTLFDQTHITHTLLYLKVQCNDYNFKIIVDTGAQLSVMSHEMAKLLNLSIDTRTKGEARGVGVTKILGIIHNCHLRIENIIIPIDFKVIENMDKYIVLLGLDFLYNHRCIIDLIGRVIKINDREFRLLNEIEVDQLTTPYDCRKENIKKLFDEMLKDVPVEKKNEVSETLIKIIKNIIENPSEDKYKNISTKNKLIEEMIGSNKNFIQFMQKIGFIHKENKLKFIDQISTLNFVKQIMTA